MATPKVNAKGPFYDLEKGCYYLVEREGSFLVESDGVMVMTTGTEEVRAYVHQTPEVKKLEEENAKLSVELKRHRSVMFELNLLLKEGYSGN